MQPASAMRSARLLGREHQRLGAVEVVAEGSVGLALSKGGAAKTYAHVDPNEDAVCFAAGEGGVLLAVADGHGGAWGAERIVEYLLAEIAPGWTGPAPLLAPDAPDAAWRALGHDVLAEANRVLLEGASERRIEPAHSTLSLALVRHDRDRWLHASIGDSHVFRIDAEGARDVAWASLERSRSFYLGYPMRGRRAEDSTLVATAPRAGLQALVLCTDGLSEVDIGVADPEAAVTEAADALGPHPERHPLELSKGVVLRALAAQRRQRAGDNVGAAVLVLEEPLRDSPADPPPDGRSPARP